MNRIYQSLRAFRDNLRGSVVIEAIIFIPAMVFAFTGFAVAWDGYRANNLAQKATYTIADILSRERSSIKKTTMTNYAKALAYASEVPTAITNTNIETAPVALRVTSVLFDEGETAGSEGNITFLWSLTTSNTQLPAHTAQSLQAIKSKIPALVDGDNIIIVESRLRWTPFLSEDEAADIVNNRSDNDEDEYNVEWFASRKIETFTTVRPRFVPKLCAVVGLTEVGCEL